MAIGAIETLKKYNYNTGDKTEYIQIVGVDAIPEAQELIQKGSMTGSLSKSSRFSRGYLLNWNEYGFWK